MGEHREHRWTPGEQLPDGRWTPGTVVKAPTGHRARVLPYDTEFPNQPHSDAVFVQPLHHPELPWQLVSSNDLTAISDESPTDP